MSVQYDLEDLVKDSERILKRHVQWEQKQRQELQGVLAKAKALEVKSVISNKKIYKTII